MLRSQRYACVALALLAASLTGCAQHYTGATYSDPYGFFSGLLHGFVFPFALLANLVSWLLSLVGFSVFSEVQLVGRPNTGLFFYYVGYVFGLSAWGGSGASR